MAMGEKKKEGWMDGKKKKMIPKDLKHIHEVLTRKYKNCSKVNDYFATTTKSTTTSYQDSYKGSGNTIA